MYAHIDSRHMYMRLYICSIHANMYAYIVYIIYTLCIHTYMYRHLCAYVCPFVHVHICFTPTHQPTHPPQRGPWDAPEIRWVESALPVAGDSLGSPGMGCPVDALGCSRDSRCSPQTFSLGSTGDSW